MAPSMLPLSWSLGGNSTPICCARSMMCATGKRFQLAATAQCGCVRYSVARKCTASGSVVLPAVLECSSICCAIRSTRPLISSGQPDRCRQKVPPVHIFNVEPPGDADIVERAGQMKAGGYGSVDASFMAAQQGCHFAETGADHLEVQIHAF